MWARSCVEVVRGSKKFYNFKVNFNKEIFERAQKIKKPPAKINKTYFPHTTKGVLRMTKLSEFFNTVSKDNRIYTAEDVGEMPLEEFRRNEKAIFHQMANLGMPRRYQLAGNDDVIYVHAYTRNDGTQVKAHYRSKHGHLTGAAANIEKSSNPQKADFSEYAKNSWNIQKNMKENANYPDAQELASIFLVRPKNAPKSQEYIHIEPGYAETINQKYNLTAKSEKKIPANWSGIAYSEDSTLSQNVSNSSELQNDIRKQYDITNNCFKKDKIDITFSNDQNLKRALGHATVLEPRIDENGYFHGILFDKYDFSSDYDYISNPFLATANNYFYLLQKTLDRNFYVLTPITFKW